MVQQSPASLFFVAVVLFVSGTAYGEELDHQPVPPAANAVHSGTQAQGNRTQKHKAIAPAQKITADLSSARPELKHSDYVLREQTRGRNAGVPDLARRTPGNSLIDVDGLPIAATKKQETLHRAPTENIPATAWSWALIPIGMGLVLFQLRRKYRRSTFRP